MRTPFHVYDTTLRDGAQQEGMNLSVTDKLAIAAQLDELGVGFIEGGWPGAVPKDTDFFARAAKELTLHHAVLAAFGATRRAGTRAGDDPQVRALLDAETPVVTLVAKSDVRHVERALRTTREENLAMIRDTVAFLAGEGRRVVLDAEHFFDGYRYDAGYALAAARTAFEAGAEVVCLCDTNGGMIPTWVSGIVAEVLDAVGGPAVVGRVDDDGRPAGPVLGMHAHNDSGCAVANTLAAVEAGATHVQGTVNGYGERTGNADLVAVTANLQLKLGMELVPEAGLREATRIAHAISEITNLSPFARQPYVGQSAFTHKAGLHASAIRVDPDLYQHMDPKDVGNDMRMLVSDMAGRASVELKGRELGFDLSDRKDVLARVTDRVKHDEARGYTYEAADASFELVLRDELGELPRYFETQSWRTIVETVPDGHTPADVYGPEAEAFAEATVKITVGGGRIVATGEGNGPVDALDRAVRQALTSVYPELRRFELIDFKVRILDTDQGTDARTRVLVETADGERSWSTVGVGPNVIEAAWEAVTGAYVYGLIKAGVSPADPVPGSPAE
ncbi:citramalate synthase [Myceligenerans salitolerans]|uniref:Citramalate synthase n=1 Tax=Myceligenerans salitolerans TaxID=1230528 RepID=A0ABS3I3F9_9MICO|nr:citramalate synthase [Myceligenerans salitolerans]MBO0607518.1 citramalate synthase [Myceligenerans salitolerans]